MRDFLVDAGGYRVAGRDWGGSGPDLVLLHGGAGNLESFAVLAPMLVDDFHVVAYDFFGHGRSENPSTFAPDLPQRELAAVVQALDLRRPLLAGSSLGAGVAKRYVLGGGDCMGIVAIDGAAAVTRDDVADLPPFDREAYAQQIRAQGWGWRGSRDEVEARVGEKLADAGGRGEPLESSTRRAIAPAGEGMFEERPTLEHIVLMREMGLRLPREWWTVEIYDRVTVPILLLCATRGTTAHGPYTDEQRARLDALPERYPNVEIEWVDAGHLIHWEQPALVADRIRSFAAARS